MGASFHIERDFETIPMNFLGMKYHQIRFVSFGIWFLGLFLTDFTAIVNTPLDGWSDVLDYLKVIAAVHVTFIGLFYIYLIFRHFTDVEADVPTWKMIIHSMFDLSLHLDIGALIFSTNFLDSKDSVFTVEAFVILDAILVPIMTPYKRWRTMIDIFGILPTVILGHVSLYHNINYVVVFLPLCAVLLSPLLFTVFSLSFSNRLSKTSYSFIQFLDPTLLPNAMIVPLNVSHMSLIDNPSTTTSRSESPPAINDRATNGNESDYFDFKSFPFAVAATFFIHFGCFCSGFHNNTMVVMAHYFLMLAAFLINTRVVGFPSIILTNVTDPGIQFNSVWPELSFV